MPQVLTGLFAQKSVAGFDGFTTIPGGWLDHHYGKSDKRILRILLI